MADFQALHSLNAAHKRVILISNDPRINRDMLRAQAQAHAAHMAWLGAVEVCTLDQVVGQVLGRDLRRRRMPVFLLGPAALAQGLWAQGIRCVGVQDEVETTDEVSKL